MAGQQETARQAKVYAGSAVHPEVDEIQPAGTTSTRRTRKDEKKQTQATCGGSYDEGHKLG